MPPPHLPRPQPKGRGFAGRGKPVHNLFLPTARPKALKHLKATHRGSSVPLSRGLVPMPGVLKLGFAPFSTPAKGVLVLFCEEGLKFGSAARKALDPTGDLITRAAAADRFKGKNGSALNLVAPAGLDVSRLVIVGVGKPRDLEAPGLREVGRHRGGQDSLLREGGDDHRRSARRRDQAGSGRRHRARRAAARLCVRALQDQAQGGRGTRRRGQAHHRGRERRAGREGVRRARGGRRAA